MKNCVGMKLEAVDFNEPEMVYVATVANVMEVRKTYMLEKF